MANSHSLRVVQRTLVDECKYVLSLRRITSCYSNSSDSPHHCGSMPLLCAIDCIMLKVECIYLPKGCTVIKCPLALRDSGAHLIHSSLDPQKYAPQTASQLPQPYLKAQRCAQHTDRPHHIATNRLPLALYAVMWAKVISASDYHCVNNPYSKY